MTDGPLGLAVIDKPAGMTSHDVVAAVRRTLGERRVGHAGTLDPPATGVLLVGVGRATRLLRFLQGTDKAYEGTIALGTATSTLDATGEVTETADMTGTTAADVAAAAATLTGELDQVPPMVSAIHVQGRRLHELAREGIEVDRVPRRVHVTVFDVEPDDAAVGQWRFHVECSTGTYVRSLVDDLGRALGGVAHVASLRRTRVGRFTLDDAVALATLTAQPRDAVSLRPPAAMVAHLRAVTASAHQALDFAHGRAVRVEGDAHAEAGPVAVLAADGSLVCVANDDGTGSLRPDVVLVSQGASSDDD